MIVKTTEYFGNWIRMRKTKKSKKKEKVAFGQLRCLGKFPLYITTLTPERESVAMPAEPIFQSSE
jgi:hypothetical protein